MKKILTNLRNKPNHIKNYYVIGFSVLATLVIVAIWITTMRLLQTSDNTVKTESPLRAFGQIFSGAVSSVKDDYSNQKKSLNQTMSEQQKVQNQNNTTVQQQTVIPQPGAAYDESEILKEEDDTGR